MGISIRNLSIGIATTVVFGLANGAALAQPPGAPPNNPPAVSPYLNLTRTGNSAGVNYYGLVKPQQEFRNAYRGLQQQVNAPQGNNTGFGLPDTGHAATFLNTGGYFLTMSAGQGQNTPGGAQRVGGTQPAGQGAAGAALNRGTPNIRR